MAKKSDSQYETFDSGSGVVIPEKSRGDFDHQDSGGALSRNGAGDAEQLDVPKLPQKN